VQRYAYMIFQQLDDDPFERFCLVLSRISEGRVCSYGRLAVLAELGGARHSCQLLKRLPKSSVLPWFRIVSSQGKLAGFSGAAIQRQQLEDEGIIFTAAGRIPKHYFL
jgi:methylated-DNA-protein-cysteine methyltransferase-like protein